MATEFMIRTESVRIPRYRSSPGSCMPLANSIDKDGMRHPICIWTDGTLVSGERRLRAVMLLQRDSINAVVVDTIEDAAKRLMADNQDEELSIPMLPSERCRLWGRMRLLDEPAAIKRLDAARRRGVELRRQTQDGSRPPGRTGGNGEEYLLEVMAEPFGISPATAARIDRIYRTGFASDFDATDEQRALAREYMKKLDAGEGSIWGFYQQLLGNAPRKRGVAPKVAAPKSPAVTGPKQLAMWDRALPTLEGVMAGLTGLGPPSPDLTPEQVMPYQARLRRIRREAEILINQMKEHTGK